MSATRSLDDTQPIPVVRGRHAARRPERPGRRRALLIAREIGAVAAVVAIVLVLARVLVGQIAYVADDAMAPTLLPGERVVVSAWGDVSPGDIVFVRSPETWASPGGEGAVRVIGMPGERVACCVEGRITVDGEGLDEPYLRGRTDQVAFDVTVPEGRVFVLADDRAAARDSRATLDADGGTIDIDDIEGRVIAVIWPPRAVSG